MTQSPPKALGSEVARPCPKVSADTPMAVQRSASLMNETTSFERSALGFGEAGATSRAEAPPLAPGYPSRAPDLDVLPGFRNPPPGYGQVPFWWWTGDDLDAERLLWQLRELHEKGISGVQVNYSHTDDPGWPTDPKDPPIFSDAWWKVYGRVSEECAKLGMGIGLSTYTIDWPNGATNLFYELFYSNPEWNAIELVDGQPRRIPGSFNPLMEGAGDIIVDGFYSEFEKHNPGKGADGLNFFFNDELKVGSGKLAWSDDFADEFRKRKGYDLMAVMPALWSDIGDITPKVRIDYADVRMSLMEERYFRPIFDWHTTRGIIFGCDNHGRGLQPHAYGDYFRASRWYSAPGHDTPGGYADVIKGKVSSSIANLYRRPRVWLEGYHSLGWGATPERLMFATRENYLYGCTLLNLHGLYYSTHGSHWEWAPPCYHFRMPYWEHMGVFLKYFDRLSYLMSQGHHVCDVAVIYPVTPYEAEMDGKTATHVAFDMGRRLMAAGINFDFIDHQSISRAVVEEGRLCVKDAQASYRVLVFPDMNATRWTALGKASDFAKHGGMVMAIGDLPVASDRAGKSDPMVDALNRSAFKDEYRFASAAQAVKVIKAAFPQDVRGVDGVVRASHRKMGPRDVYLLMDASPGHVVEFRAKGKVELWDPWTGDVSPLRVVKETATGTQVELPLEKYEAQVVVFTPGEGNEIRDAGCEIRDTGSSVAEAMEDKCEIGGKETRVCVVDLSDEAWHVAFEPTMDNRYGDFRLPVTPENKTIGIEARRFAWARESSIDARTAMRPETDDSKWQRQLHGYGPQFYQLSVPKSLAGKRLDTKLAALRRVDPSVPVVLDGQRFLWKPYDFSWRYGQEGDPGHQGFHGLKGTVSENFIRLGKRKKIGGGVNILSSEGDRRYYLWSTVTVREPVAASIHVSQPAPSAGRNYSQVTTPTIFIDGARIEETTRPVALDPGSTPVLLRYDDHGESHFVLRRNGIPLPTAPQTLAMKWYKDPGVIPFDVHAGARSAEWFRFLSAPGTTAIRCQTPVDGIDAWIDGEPMIDQGDGRFVPRSAAKEPAVIALRLSPETGQSGGAAIPEAITIETSGQGTMPLGDWSKMGILNNYSGGVRYRRTVQLGPADVERISHLELGKVVATAEVWINGRKVGVRVAPPWKLDVGGFLREGENTLEIVVYNTLANHYQTIPSLYRGDPVSGLFGPVSFLGKQR